MISAYFLIAAFIILLCMACTMLSVYKNKIWWQNYDIKPYNFPFKYKGRTLWYSRSIAVASFIFAKDKEKGQWHVLANRRGSGAPDFQGAWNCCCGYCDFNEKCVETARREVMEETGIPLDVSFFKFIGINDDPFDSNKQNITIRYKVTITDNTIEDLTPRITKLGEKDEVSEVKWIPINKIDDYVWAFNHDTIIKLIFTSHDNNHETI